MSSRWKFFLVTVGALLSFSATFALGQWQLSRAAQKLAWLAAIESKAALPPTDQLSLSQLSEGGPELNRRVRLRGQWLADATVYLDNRQMNSRQGMVVLTPMKLDGSGAVVVVQRGWVARNFINRKDLAALSTPAGPVEIQGRIVAPPSRSFSFPGPDSGRIRQNLDLAAFSVELGLPLLPVSVQQSSGEADGLARDWPVFEAGADMHYGYAFQWFGLSALVATLFIWFQIVRRFILPRHA